MGFMTHNTDASSPRRWSRQGGDCSVPECSRPSIKTGYCGAHYQRWRKHGDPTLGGPIRAKQAEWGVGRCAVEGCETPNRKRGWCLLHYDRWKAHGNPLVRSAPVGHKRIAQTGYVWVHCNVVPGSPFLEHRIAWESVNPPLLPGQNIHHKNGNKADNRLANLEIWDTTQPAGQRPEDKVAFAIEMLKRYAPDILR